MRISHSSCCALSLCATAMTLFGCGGSQPSIGAMPQSGALLQRNAPMVAHPGFARSWMAPEAKSSDLLYVSDGDVYVLTYPKGKLVGTLTGLDFPQGECVDKTGDVFITNGVDSAGDVLEYRHGGTHVARTLTGVNSPEDCSVDPTTGNLAVTENSGSVAIFRKAQGKPKGYYYGYPSHSPEVYNCAYDNKGDLFIDAEFIQNYPSGFPIFAVGELAKGGKKIETIWTPEGTQTSAGYPGGLQWDGKHLAVGDSISGVVYINDDRQLTLEGADGVMQFWIQGGTLIGPNSDANTVTFWKYPAGGSPTKVLNGFSTPYGATVSLAK